MKTNRFCRVPDSDLVPIEIPPDIDPKIERAVRQLGRFEAACVWCSYGYAEYTREAEDQHFAYNCPDAPEELRQHAKARLLFSERRKHKDSAGE